MSYGLAGEGADVLEMGWDRVLGHGQRLRRPLESASEPVKN